MQLISQPPPPGFDSWCLFMHNTVIDGDLIQTLQKNLQGEGNFLGEHCDSKIHEVSENLNAGFNIFNSNLSV